MTAALFRLEEVADGGSAAFTATIAGRPTSVMALRRGGRVFVYVNACPHVGAPLDMVAGRFLNLEKTHILCSTHGALFRVEDGHCVWGPCHGRALAPVAVSIEGGAVFLRGSGGDRLSARRPLV